jgi:predicted DNA-binding helix-hairpin-helix protein
MNIREKLTLLGQAAQYDDRTGLFATHMHPPSTTPDLIPCVSYVQAPGGHHVPVLKVLQTSVCQNDCRYCVFRAERDVQRGHFTPDELARAFDLMQRAGVVQGLFLSSGIAGTLRTMDEMLATVELVRLKYEYRGYVHLKLLPDTQPEQVARAVVLADRVSTNLEAPNAERLAVLAPKKRMSDLVGPLRTAAELIRQDRLAHGSAREAIGRTRLGMSTQFVVGPAGETDRELLGAAQMLYREVRLARAYFSAFSPVSDTPLADEPPTDPRREFRLYQADWLLRFYHFTVDELPFAQDGQLSTQTDPKTAWARAHPERFPVEVNRASVGELLRVPGIGPVSARAIVQARQSGRLASLGELRRLGARADQAAPYVLLGGRRPPVQMPLAPELALAS